MGTSPSSGNNFIVPLFYFPLYFLQRLLPEDYLFLVIAYQGNLRWVEVTCQAVIFSNFFRSFFLQILTFYLPLSLSLSVVVLLAHVLPHFQLIFSSKTQLFGIYLKSLLNQYLPHFESKSYQINSIKFCSLRSFQQHQRNIPILPKFSTMI